MTTITHTLNVAGTGPQGALAEGPLQNASTAGIDARGSLLLTGSYVATTPTPPATATILRLMVPVWPASPHNVLVCTTNTDVGISLGANWGFADIPIVAGTANFYLKGTGGTNQPTVYYSYH